MSLETSTPNSEATETVAIGNASPQRKTKLRDESGEGSPRKRTRLVQCTQTTVPDKARDLEPTTTQSVSGPITADAQSTSSAAVSSSDDDAKSDSVSSAPVEEDAKRSAPAVKADVSTEDKKPSAHTQSEAPVTSAEVPTDATHLHRCLRLTDPTFKMIPMPKLSQPSTKTPPQYQLELAVPRSASGHLIGRGGSKINATREISGASVKLLDHIGTATFRSIVISGTFAQCRSAFGMVAEQVNDQVALANPNPTGHQHTLTLLVPNNKVGGLIGQKGAVINEFRSSSGASITLAKVDEMHNGSMDRCATITGTFHQVQKGWKLVSEKLSSIVPTKENAPIKHNIVTSGFRGGNSQMQGHMSRTIVHNIVLTNDQAGVIIGRGGSHINEMRKYTGCDIRIGPPSGRDKAFRNVKITGPSQQIQLVQSIIVNKLQQTTTPATLPGGIRASGSSIVQPSRPPGPPQHVQSYGSGYGQSGQTVNGRHGHLRTGLW